MLAAKTSAHLSSSSVKPLAPPEATAEAAFDPAEKPVAGKRGRPDAASDAAVDATTAAPPVTAAAAADDNDDVGDASAAVASRPAPPSPPTAAATAAPVAGRRASPPHKSPIVAPVTPGAQPTAAPATPKTATVHWQFKKDLRKGDKNDAAYADYAAAESAQIEALYAKYKAAPGKKLAKAVSEPILNKEYRVDFVNMIQYRKDDPMKQRPIRRKEA
jgi:hypothetical protein